jgi:DNA-binding PadR family transcriptional regulator
MRVLRALLDAYPGSLTGTDLMKQIGDGFGTLYRLLARFERAGWIRGKWEVVDPAGVCQRYYTLAGVGIAKARECLADFAPVIDV